MVTELFVNVRGKDLLSARNKFSSVKPCSPLRIKWLMDIFFEHIRETPNLSNATMCKVMEAYVPDYAITENLLQKARTEREISVFSVPSRNVQYCRVLKLAMDKQGHLVKLIFATYNATVLALSKILVDEENR